MKRLVIFLLIISLPNWSFAKTETVKAKAAVAMPDSYSAIAAKNTLEQGGNAIDAAITAQFVLAVTLPEAGNIGGGGFMLIRKDGKNDFIDYREKAPLLAHRDMYLDADGNVVENKSLFGIFASGVPGTVAGMWLAHQKHGSLPWATLVQPAIDLAEHGFVIHPKLADEIDDYIAWLERNQIEVNFKEHFASATAGVTFKQAQLSQTLIRIRDKGEAGFYQGETAKLLVDFMQANKGLISKEDLLAYKAVSRTPILEDWREYQVLSAPPPSSGGIAIVQWLKMYDATKPKTGSLAHNSAQYMHLLAEAGKRVFADRAQYLGDPDFYEVPQTKLVDANYIEQRAKSISSSNISATESIKPGLKESEETTHFSIVDKWGNAVSNTTTINLGFGSGMVVTGAGFLLNDEMDDLSSKVGVANVFGAIGGQANAIEPQKRPLSSMTPTILLKDNKVHVVTGSPGGTTIITSVYQSLLNVVDHKMSAEEAVNAPRFHHQLWPKNVIRHHNGIEKDVQQELQKMGYVLDNHRFGDIHLIINNDGSLDAGSEDNGRGQAIVF